MHLPPFASMVRVLGDPQVLLVLILYPWTWGSGLSTSSDCLVSLHSMTAAWSRATFPVLNSSPPISSLRD